MQKDIDIVSKASNREETGGAYKMNESCRSEPDAQKDGDELCKSNAVARP